MSLFPDMREHDGLLKPEELQTIENLAKTEYVDSQSFYSRFETKNAKIKNILQDFLDSK